MKFRVVIAAALAALSPGVLAQDLLADTPAAAGPFDWTGFYVGLHVGHGRGTANQDIAVDSILVPVDLSGALGGFDLQYLHQLDRFVFGLEVEANLSAIAGTNEVQPNNFFNGGVTAFGSANLKGGFAADKVLFYATAGAAAAVTTVGQSVGGFGFDLQAPAVGFALGVGADVAVTDNLVIGANYRYYDLQPVAFDPPGGYTDRSQTIALHTVTAGARVKLN